MTLKELRKEKKLTIGSLAKLAGISSKTMSDLEKNPKKARAATFGKVAGALGITEEELRALVLPPKRKRAGAGEVEDVAEGSIALDDVHVNRIIRLIDDELAGLHHELLDGLEALDSFPAVGRYLDMLNADVDLLIEIKGLLQG